MWFRPRKDNSRIQFMASGKLSEKLRVTSGIRQGCPLAPLLFIIAVDLLYDVIDDEEQFQGIQIGGIANLRPLKVAGYADDTAIYIAHKAMQKIALQAVRRFSSVSGLKLNMQKSAALQLGKGNDIGDEQQTHDDEQVHNEANSCEVETTRSTRYLEHTAGSRDITAEAWDKAFAALSVRLALAEVKTNIVQQRADIAAAIIVPKMLAPAGWIQSALAEQPTKEGGIGIPNIGTELMAMGAMVVGTWAMTQDRHKQRLGEILQERDTGEVQRLIPRTGTPKPGPQATLWDTGEAERNFSLLRAGRTGIQTELKSSI
ncbi:unnamed protein product [Phytophthora fragariaefolia]|uniref:Unnamed protein product n=1 Tax=Phytophthora fragariaefolia TaxID=1490495 RepID=A0A9W6TKG8_9STRA|nr:unnamed protein product [Phytophthora fragariaefolia]